VERLTERIMKGAREVGEAAGYEYAEAFKRFEF
jgi:hypothetical protein